MRLTPLSRPKRFPLRRVILALAIGVLAISTSKLPFVQEELAPRISELRARITYALAPPGEAVFTPNPTLAAMVDATLAAFATPAPPQEPTSAPTADSGQASTPSPIPTGIPSRLLLTGIRHEYQGWNNCGPATLAMALSFWGWIGDQRPVAQYVKPNPRDKNVMPYELADFVRERTDLEVVVRMGGELPLLKSLIAAGFPVVIEKGLEVPGVDGWMGHYEVLAGYDDASGIFNAYDSYEGDFSGGNTLAVSYQTIETNWRHFNHTYLIIYPPERGRELFSMLGADADEQTNIRRAAERASEEIFSTSGRDLFFAWFNRGTNLMLLQDYGGAATAYDQAFQVYAELDPEVRPWRVMWYQTGPYFAYYYSGRYWDVIGLATQTLDNMSEPVLEESYYWRGLAKEALGDVAGAIADYQSSLDLHTGFGPALTQLARLGVAP
ncbi:MAG: C39 family peptidase [Anaerolineales bacterium]